MSAQALQEVIDYHFEMVDYHHKQGMGYDNAEPPQWTIDTPRREANLKALKFHKQAVLALTDALRIIQISEISKQFAGGK